MRQMIVVFVQQNLCRALKKILICRWLKRIKHSRFYVEGWGNENLMFIERKKNLNYRKPQACKFYL